VVADLLVFLIETAFLIAIILGLIILVQGVRKIPINYAKQIVGNRQFTGASQFLPLKVNAVWCNADHFRAGDHVPSYIVFFYNISRQERVLARIFNNPSNGWYMFIYAVMVIAFTFLYTALDF
jgi:preprotein translocase subunit SecY